jgi:hypothetical protein
MRRRDLARGLVAIAFSRWSLAFANEPAAGPMPDNSSEEGQACTIVDAVNYLSSETHRRVNVGLIHRAQAFFVNRAERDFDDKLRRLRSSFERKAPVRITYREYSGRIMTIEYV